MFKVKRGAKNPKTRSKPRGALSILIWALVLSSLPLARWGRLGKALQ